MGDTSSGLLAVRCKCGKKLKMPAKAAGRRAKCPNCARIFTVPAPKEPDAPLEFASETDETDLALDELVQQGQAATPKAPDDGTHPCPSCNTPVPPGAVICVSCGYDSRIRQAHKAASGKTALASKLASLTGTLVFGCLLSSAGALVGALIWFGIAVVTNYEIGWIAWAIGALAGYGMLLGCSDGNQLSGVAAAGISICGVLAAKGMVFVFVIAAVITGDTSNVLLQREFVKGMMADERVAEKGVMPRDDYDAAWDAAYDRADATVEDYSDDEVREAWQGYRDKAAEDALRTKRWLLAIHHGRLRVERAGLWDGDENDRIFEEEEAKFASKTSDELDAELEKVERWEAGKKWDDPDYVRDFLIYQHAGEVIDERSAAFYENLEKAEAANESQETKTDAEDKNEDDEEYYETSPEEWKQIYAAAAAKVDAMTRVERSREATRIEDEREERHEEYLKEYEQAESLSEANIEDAEEVIASFFGAMFGPMDILFFLFAAGSAYKIGGGSGDD